MRSSSLAFLVTLCTLLAAHGRAQAQPVIFSDRFDCYCSPSTCPTSFCETGSSRSDGQLRSVWPWVSYNYNTGRLDGANWVIEDNQIVLWSAPFGGRHANGGDEGQKLGQNQVNLIPHIQAASSGSDEINGTDDQPLVLDFYMSGGIQPANGIRYSNGYMELAFTDEILPPRQPAASDQAPTDYVMVGSFGPGSPECWSCYGLCRSQGIQNSGVHVPWPTICQQEFPSEKCPPLQTNVRSALAVGALALLDNNPCHCENPDDQVPQNDHLSLYDGLKWRILRSGMFPKLPGFEADSDSFVHGDKLTHVIMWVRTNTIDLYHRSRVNGTWVVSTAQGIPREYVGSFNVLRAGTGVGCELNNGSYSCANGNIAGMKPIRMGDVRCDGGGWQTNKSKYIAFDHVELLGGDVAPSQGACCLPDTTCMQLTEEECLAQEGAVFNGVLTNCASVTCCPVPFADADVDGDVDQKDFAQLQLCLSAGAVSPDCTCFDRFPGGSADGQINGDDFSEFANCVTGPDVPWVAANTPNCVP